MQNEAGFFKCGPFSIVKGGSLETESSAPMVYCLESKTTASNLQRVMRCLLMDQPIMLEGSPGVGKTSLVEALARITQNKVIRINLSEQTDLNELFGADLPCAVTNDNQSGVNQQQQQQRFDWHDGPFLLALKHGYWIILDEINLASQPVLEGLNACFDHRGQVYISELGRTFHVDKRRTKIFACQNPFTQGGGRKGLPRSFLNRFSKVYIDQMTRDDLLFIVSQVYPRIDRASLERMIAFNARLNREICVEKKWATLGSPWEFNLRDVFRWCDLISASSSSSSSSRPGDFVYLIYANRLRTRADRTRCYEVFGEEFGLEQPPAYQQEHATRFVRFTSSHVQIGQAFWRYDEPGQREQQQQQQLNRFLFTDTNLRHFESILKCLEMNWLCVLVGRSCTGKTTLVRTLASLLGVRLVEFSVNNSTDTSDLLGGFEKVKHLKYQLEAFADKLRVAYHVQMCHRHNAQLTSAYLTYLFQSKRLFAHLATRLDEAGLDLVAKFLDLFRGNVGILAEHKVGRLLEADLVALEVSLSETRKMKFEWLDSALVKAIEHGHWVLIDNANFCSPSVLDRLNSLLEQNGSLQINEKGLQTDTGKLVELKAHAKFRLILSMNDAFGELSRPMRNRGVEIYLDELSVRENFEDVALILSTLFPFAANLLDLNSVYASSLALFKATPSFFDLFKIFKLTYNYWLLDEQKSMSNSWQKSLEDFKLVAELKSESELATVSQPACELKRIFYTDVFKLKQFVVYRFLFDFPLFDQFLDNSASLVEESRHTSHVTLDNYNDLFVDNARRALYVKEWFQSVPLDAYEIIAQFTRNKLNERMSSSRQHKPCDGVDQLFELLESINGSSMVRMLAARLESVSVASGDLNVRSETIDVKANAYLCHRLANTSDRLASSLVHLSHLASLFVKFCLAKYRLDTVYPLKSDSLLALIDSFTSNKETYQFLKLVKTFTAHFVNDLFAYLLSIADDDDEKFSPDEFGRIERLAESTFYLVEKFQLICSSCTFDSFLTSSYLRYYWNFIFTGLKQIQEVAAKK
jgi:MoxR-like ATPase